MRKRRLFILLFSGLIAGCASSQHYAMAVNSWRGASATALVQHWGYPTRQVLLLNGDQLYVYQESSSGVKPVNDIFINNKKSIFTGDHYYVLKCTTWFEINRKHQVIDAHFRGNNCVFAKS